MKIKKAKGFYAFRPIRLYPQAVSALISPIVQPQRQAGEIHVPSLHLAYIQYPSQFAFCYHPSLRRFRILGVRLVLRLPLGLSLVCGGSEGIGDHCPEPRCIQPQGLTPNGNTEGIVIDANYSGLGYSMSLGL